MITKAIIKEFNINMDIQYNDEKTMIININLYGSQQFIIKN